MPDNFTIDASAGESVAREKMIAYINVGTSVSPQWAPFGRKVTASSIALDWSTETNTDILGDTFTKGKKATKTQDFDPWEITGGDLAQQKILNLAIVDNDVQALLNQDCLIVHFYLKDSLDKPFAERYEGCSVLPTSNGGDGGGNLGFATTVAYGGKRTKGTATVDASTGAVTFTPDSE